jgi:hypothetical protein
MLGGSWMSFEPSSNVHLPQAGIGYKREGTGYHPDKWDRGMFGLRKNKLLQLLPAN